MERLSAALQLLGQTKILADVGCDHGKFCYRALCEKRAEKVYACDISAPSLDKARSLLKEFDSASFFHCDGLSGVPDDFTALSLCGMGAALMLSITADYKKDAAIIMQPQNHARQVREQMSERGYALAEEILACERGKFYPVMRFERGERILSPLQLRFGLHAENPPPELTEMCRLLKRKYSQYPLTDSVKSELEDIEEILKCR